MEFARQLTSAPRRRLRGGEGGADAAGGAAPALPASDTPADTRWQQWIVHI